MNRKKIFIIIIIMLLLSFVLFLYIQNSCFNTVDSSNGIYSYNNTNDTEKTINNVLKNEIIENNKINVDISSKTDTNNIETNTSKVTSNNSKSTTNKNNICTTNKTKRNNKVPTNVNSNSTDNNSINSNDNTKETIHTQIKDDTVRETYKINNSMINKMKTIINNNPSDDMKEFGYNIVIDNSIVTLTNQFTCTEKRLISKLEYKFGTIRIYARDLYVNNEFTHTECFIY